jgi:small GTP-binding protein
MNIFRTTTGLMWIVVMASVGLALLIVPPWVAEQVRVVSQAGRVWLWLYLTLVGLGAVLLLAATVAVVSRLYGRTRRKRERRQQRSKDPNELSRREQALELKENLAAAEDLKAELPADEMLRRELDPLAAKIVAKQESRRLEIVAFGAISSGKSSLLNSLAGRDIFATDPKGGTTLQRNEVPWPGMDRVILVDTPGLGEIDGVRRSEVSADAAEDADIVLVVVDGPLRAWEHELLCRLGDMQKRLVVCVNKGDWYDAIALERLLGQLREQVRPFVSEQDVIAVRAQPVERPVVRQLADGSQIEETVAVPADIAPLAERMMQIVRKDGSDLLLANLLLQSRGLVEEARTRVRMALDRRAWELVDRYMWGAGGAAALSPFPVLDLVAGCAISTKMVVDLARVYRQDVDLSAATRLIAELGKNLVAILGISVATPAITSAVASLLKTVPGVGTLAGGVLQGIVQALVTRWIGAVFIEYFKSEMQQPEGGLASIARREWQRMTTVEQLYRLVNEARSKFTGPREEQTM